MYCLSGEHPSPTQSLFPLPPLTAARSLSRAAFPCHSHELITALNDDQSAFGFRVGNRHSGAAAHC